MLMPFPARDDAGTPYSSPFEAAADSAANAQERVVFVVHAESADVASRQAYCAMTYAETAMRAALEAEEEEPYSQSALQTWEQAQAAAAWALRARIFAERKQEEERARRRHAR